MGVVPAVVDLTSATSVARRAIAPKANAGRNDTKSPVRLRSLSCYSGNGGKRRAFMLHTYKTTELAPADRVAVERLLGRVLQNDEAVEVIVHKTDHLRRDQDTAPRKEAAARIRELAKGKSLGGVTIRELIEEGRRF
jgi:hypothetical protein